MLAGAVESELMRSDLEPFVRQLDRFDLSLIIDQDIVYAIALLADKMLVPFDQRVEVLRPTPHQDLQLFIGDEFLQVPINRAKTDARQFFPHAIVYLIRGRMGFIVLDCLPNDLQLSGIACVSSRLRHA